MYYPLLRTVFCFVLFINNVFASGINITADTTNTPWELIKPCMVTNHPLGIFMMRVDHNFNTSPPKKMEFIFNMAAANVWLPLVKGYQPIEAADKEFIKTYVWDKRQDDFNPDSMPNKLTQFHADAVIHSFKPQLNIRLNKKSELRVMVPFYYIDKGKRPMTYFTNDQTIEDFHSHHKKISGGEDPFARRVYGFDKVNINYMDENGRTIDINKNTLVFPGMETHYYYYPSFNTKKNAVNVGIHTGINTSAYNRSLDFGTSFSFVKRMKRNNKREYILALGGSAIRNKLFELKNNVSLNSNKFICAGEGEFAFLRKIKKAYFSIGLNYFVQTRYNKKKDFDSLILKGEREYSSHWHWAMTQFYETLETWSLIFTYSRKVSLSIYIKEDLHVNNAPDLQTGFMFQVPF
jgi:hypothetical protein